jgi:Leucine-rich repeat (LRR) protein
MKYKTTEDITAAEWLISPPGDTLLETLTYKGVSQAAFEESSRLEKRIKENIGGIRFGLEKL